MPRILVTGAAGFLGLHIVRRLLEKNRPVRALVRTEAGAARIRAARLRGAGHLEIVIEDLSRRFAIPPLLKGCDAVIHAAGRVSSLRRTRTLIYRDNVEAAAHVLEAALAARLQRFVFVSSVFALGRTQGPMPADEQQEFNLNGVPSDYVQAKRLVDLEALRTGSRGLPLILATPTFCLGPGDIHGSSQLFLSPDPTRPRIRPAGHLNVVDVRDAATGIVNALDLGTIGERYILGGSNIPCADLYLLIARALEPPPGDRTLQDHLRRLTRIGLRPPMALLPLLGRLGEALMESPPLDRTRAALLGGDWRYQDIKARQALEYKSRPLAQTLESYARWRREAHLEAVI